MARTARRVGLRPVRARAQLQQSFPRAGIQPLPAGKPGRVQGSDLGIHQPNGSLTFYVIGDHGGIKTPSPQNAVSCAMETAAGKDKPAFVFSVGDVVYFNGDASEYAPQFYEPYAKLAVPVVAIPGNHDGDTTDDPSRPPLDTFLANFCSPSPSTPAADPQLEYGRHTQTQPWCDWTLDLDLLTIIGLYSNVPSGGHLEQSQIDWLTAELAAADAGKPVIVALHHPPYSVDAHHGGSQHMGDALDQAFTASKRPADLVLSGHVHDYQRFTRNYQGKQIPYIVIGNSGYHNLHQLASDAAPGADMGAGVTFEFGDASQYGYLKLMVASGKLAGEYVGVKPGTMPDGSDATSSPAVDTFTA